MSRTDCQALLLSFLEILPQTQISVAESHTHKKQLSDMPLWDFVDI